MWGGHKVVGRRLAKKLNCSATQVSNQARNTKPHPTPRDCNVPTLLVPRLARLYPRVRVVPCKAFRQRTNQSDKVCSTVRPAHSPHYSPWHKFKHLPPLAPVPSLSPPIREAILCSAQIAFLSGVSRPWSPQPPSLVDRALDDVRV